MPSFSGQFELQQSGAATGQSGPCQVTFDDETLTLTPATGSALAIDLGDIEIFTAGDYDLALTLYTQQKLQFRQFGKAFQNLAHDLLEAYRNRVVECLLLEDLEEVARFDGHAQLDSKSSPERSFASPAELRLHRSNLAVLPTQATAAQWRLAEIDGVTFDEQAYAVTLHSGQDTLRVTRLAKRTGEFRERSETSITANREKAAQVLHRLLPFLTPGEFQKAAMLLREGQPASFGNLNGVNSKIERALYENIVNTQLKPYCDALREFAPAGSTYTGFKFIRQEEGESEETEGAAEAAAPPGEAKSAGDAGSGGVEPILHWFFFPVAKPSGNQPSLVAWEAASRGGRATYFFRLSPPGSSPNAGQDFDSAIRQLNRALVLLNFRRAPIYLSDEKLEIDPRYRRYAIACRKLPELRLLRASFVGRAIHTSLEAWRKQVESLLAGF